MIALKFILQAMSWFVIGMLVAAVFPIWPYKYYELLRVVVTCMAIVALIVLAKSTINLKGLLVITAIVFNPIIPIHLNRVLWFPIDLWTASVFWTFTYYVREKMQNKPEACPQ